MDLCPQHLRKLWGIWDSSKYPSYHYIQKLPVHRVHLYTFVQALFRDSGLQGGCIENPSFRFVPRGFM